MSKAKRSIELQGRFRKFLNPINDGKRFIFLDKDFGEVTCVIPKSSILYYGMQMNKEYIITVRIKGSSRNTFNGKMFMQNELIVQGGKIIESLPASKFSE